MIKNVAIVLADIRLARDRSALIFYPHAAGKFNFHLDAEDRKVELMIISLRIDHFINISCAANNHKFKTKDGRRIIQKEKREVTMFVCLKLRAYHAKRGGRVSLGYGRVEISIALRFLSSINLTYNFSSFQHCL